MNKLVVAMFICLMRMRLANQRYDHWQKMVAFFGASSYVLPADRTLHWHLADELFNHTQATVTGIHLMATIASDAAVHLTAAEQEYLAQHFPEDISI